METTEKTENKCSYQFTKGVSKNKICGVSISLTELTCKKHTKENKTEKKEKNQKDKTTSVPKLKHCTFLMKNGPRKELPCNESLLDDVCPIHKPIHITKWKGTSYYVLSKTDIVFDPITQLIIGHRNTEEPRRFIPNHRKETDQMKKYKIKLDL